MPHLLLHLRHVPADESDEVRALLRGAGIDFYETAPSRWGVSHGGIWLPDDGDIVRAKALLADYQAERSARARSEWAAARAEGRAETFADVVRREPLRVLGSVIAIAFLLALVALPVWWLWRG